MATKGYLCIMESKRSYNGPRRPSEKTFVYGIHPVAEALDSDKNIDRIVVSRHGKNERLNKLISQAFAIVPGVSRSGATISMALLSGWNRKDAAKFSFLLGIPSISLAAFVEFFSSLNQFSAFPFLPLFAGLITTFFSSLLAINFLIKYVSSHGLKIFVYYRLVFGILILFNL